MNQSTTHLRFHTCFFQPAFLFFHTHAGKSTLVRALAGIGESSSSVALSSGLRVEDPDGRLRLGFFTQVVLGSWWWWWCLFLSSQELTVIQVDSK
jgi:hypothetical protein